MEDLLTNESLRGMFKDSFELTHFAIEVGKRSIPSGNISLKEVLSWVRKHPREEDLHQLDESFEGDDE